MKSTPHPTPEELLLNESFLNYYFKKNEADIWEWEEYLEDFPQHQNVVKEAITILDTLSLKWSESQIRAKYAQLEESILHESLPVVRASSFGKPAAWWSWGVGVAAAVVVLLISWVLYVKNDPSPIYSQLVQKQPLIERINTTERPMLVTLSDGSSILLQQGSRLSFSEKFDETKREVYLDGEAFFEVTQNPSQPFYVYANEIITKVLGTSFSINARNSQDDIKVVVHTGKVSVYKQNLVDKKSALKRDLVGVVIAQNQALVYNREMASFAKSLVTDPQLIKENQLHEFEFKDEAASTVFAQLQKAYGIEIIYNEELLKDCPITASLTDEPLYRKLDLICRAIEAQYELVDGQVIVNSKGCR